ncbi:CGNR zinc finger domain-containing protein [Streptomyces sp. NPDC001339]|uniref:CGNR zinc finger domain-containing protein n=1 Tax=Streptomyces sp. NPDC001339 TaxID=3364563 RepID=UPI0036BB046D
MQLNPYGDDRLRLVADLTNTPPTSVSELVDRCLAAGMALDRPADEEDLAQVLAFVERWAEVVDAPTHERRVELLNALLSEASTHPRVTDHAGIGWHIHYREDGIGLGGVLRTIGAVGTALHLTELGMHRLGRCTLAECGNAYVDFSRAGQQRYCSQGCANRDAVRRHRARRAGRATSAAPGGEV